MLLTTLLCLSLAAPVEERLSPRLRGSLAGAFGGIGPRTVAGGPGFSGELGVTLIDRVSLVARLNAGTIWVLTALQGTLGVGLALSDHLELSVGVATGFPFGMGEGIFGDLSILVPMRVMVAPQPRSAGARREGLMLFLEVAPGAHFFSFLEGRSGLSTPGFSLGAWLGIGYAWW